MGCSESIPQSPIVRKGLPLQKRQSLPSNLESIQYPRQDPLTGNVTYFTYDKYGILKRKTGRQNAIRMKTEDRLRWSGSDNEWI